MPPYTFTLLMCMVSYPRLVRELSLTWSKIWEESVLAKKHNWTLFFTVCIFARLAQKVRAFAL